jgi:hypothetical protein
MLADRPVHPAPRRPSPRSVKIAAGLALIGLATTGAVACTSRPPLPTGPYQLLAFASCDDALAGLRAATKAAVGPYGLGTFVIPGLPPQVGPARGEVGVPDQAGNGAQPGDGAQAGPGAQPGPVPGYDYSGTNVQESGVDEPDLVKTDGRRIVTISGGRLSVVDVATRRLVGVVDLRGTDGGPGVPWDGDLLLAGDHALVISNGARFYGGPAMGSSVSVAPPDDVPPVAPPIQPRPNASEPDVAPPDVPDPTPVDTPVTGPSLLLVDLNAPRILSQAQADGSIVDARQVGSTVRVVLRSAPRLSFPTNLQGSDEQRLAANRAVIDAAGIDAWAPRLEVTTAGQTVRSEVGCESITRPTSYSGTNLLTVLSFDVAQDALSNGSPVTIAADGDTVYSNATSLYVASNEAWVAAWPQLAGSVPAQPRTDIYRFDTAASQPRFVGGGSVPGQLLNQYSMSEWNGVLRVATTTDTGQGSNSGVYVLAPAGGRLVPVGAVDGLGKGERIYAVRFVGPVGYVVTFRQVDPLYTVDLSDPARPTVRGELQILGYSAYLHPVGDTRLIGVGQDATDNGRVRGTQVSLFDVSSLDAPARLAHYTLPGAYSEAEFDPHAFLFWPSSGLLVLPVNGGAGVVEPVVVEDGTGVGDQSAPNSPFRMAASGALVLRVSDNQISEVGFVSHPGDPYGYTTPIQRSLVTVDPSGETTLWTVGADGILATDAGTLAPLAWIPL